MKMYTQYTNNYESAVVMLEQSANDKDVLHQFIQRCYGGRADVLTFDSYLIMPIQRCLVTALVGSPPRAAFSCCLFFPCFSNVEYRDTICCSRCVDLALAVWYNLNV